jgi:DNA-binding Lrp family transcriptional regulator
VRLCGRIVRVDDIDRQIVALLVEDARRSWSGIGDRVGLSAPAVARRVDRLERDGVVAGYTAQLGPAGREWPTEAFVELFCGNRTSTADIAATVKGQPEVLAAYTVTGDADAMVHIAAADTAHLEKVIERIRAHPNVVRTQTQIVLTKLLERPPH